MRAIGLRAEPTKLHWAVVEGQSSAPVLVAHDKAAPPVHASEAAQLSWYRDRLRLLVETHDVEIVGVRFAETFGRMGKLEPALRRSRIEGVLLEAAHSCQKRVIAGALQTISSKLGSRRAKQYVEVGEFRGLDLSTLPDQRKEAVLAGVAALAEGEAGE
jgi:hypothetical protein